MRWWNRKTYGNHIGGIWVDWTLAWGCRSGAFESNLSPKLPFNGERVRLDQICSKGKSSLRLKDLQGGGEYAVYGASGVAGAIATYQNDRPYVAVVKDGAGVGRASLCEPRTSVLGTMQALIPSERVDCSYLLHLVRSLRLGSGYSGSTIPHIYFKDYGKLVVPLPPIPEQRNIAGQLDALEAAMRVCDEQAAVLSKLVKSRFVEMFGDPVGNPMDWNVHKLGELGSLKNGLNFSAEETGYEIPCLGVADFADRFSIRGVDRLSVVGLAERPKSELFLRDGDIVFVRSNGNKKLVGRCLVVYPHDDELVFSGFCIRYRLESKILRVPFLVWTLKQASMRQRLVGRGSNVKNLNQKILSSLEVPVPPIELQDAFANFAAQVDKSRFGIQREGTSVLDFKAPVVWLGADDVRGGELRSKS